MKVVIPTELEDITIGKWMEFVKVPQEDTVQQIAVLCDMKPDDVRRMDLDSLSAISDALVSLEGVGQEEKPLRRILRVREGIFGFHPDLDAISVGEYADLEVLCRDLEGNMHKVMALLYRPILKQHGDFYEIAPYTGREDAEPFKEVTMDVAMGVVDFFLRIGLSYSNDLLQSSKEERNPTRWQRSGVGTLLSTISRKVTSQRWKP